MPKPRFTRPWQGVPRESIKWNPEVLEDACIGCFTCVTGCSRLVYRCDFDREKPAVVDPLNCVVGCTTCANTCPVSAIRFLPFETVLSLDGLPVVRHAVEDDFVARKEVVGHVVVIPHPDRILTLVVDQIENASKEVNHITLEPITQGECFCAFAAGQYIELWRSSSADLSRSCSIANAPSGDGRLVLYVGQVEVGRFTSTVFLPAVIYLHGGVVNALRQDHALIDSRDICAAGPPAMLQARVRELETGNVDGSRLHLDSFGTYS